MKRLILGLALATVASAGYTQYSHPLQSANDDLSANIEYLAPGQHEESSLADDGYRYKTIRRLRHRHRRDVNELARAEYLPPHQELSNEHAKESLSSLPSFRDLSRGYGEPTDNYLDPADQEQTLLDADGYHYKTVRRLRHRHRHRRDVSELVSNEYLPPHHEISSEYGVQTAISPDSHQDLSSGHEELTNSYLAPIEEEQSLLADDGYRYKTVRRLRHRQRRDVSELGSNEYLPPHHELSHEYAEQTISAPDSHQELSSGHEELTNSYLAPIEEEQSLLADDGYRYKTVRRLRHRQRRDVSELGSNEYLPPHHEISPEYAEQTISAPDSHQELSSGHEELTNSYLAPLEGEQTLLADDGYRYKTVRRLRHRHRRDVSELGTDGYRYKAVRKFKVRRH